MYHPQPHLCSHLQRRRCFARPPPQIAKSVDGKPKEILKGLTGYAEPSHLLALMGPSGSGKTTLLDTLAGRLHGSVRMEGEVRPAPPRAADPRHPGCCPLTPCPPPLVRRCCSTATRATWRTE